jgi:NADP-dependent 3-hydroxy acid dehydrogenase YdfG
VLPQGSVGVVTGASSGIGRAIALALAAEGVQVHAVGRDAERLAELAGEATKGGIVATLADLESEKDLDVLAETIRDEYGTLDLLVHSAGAIRIGDAESLGPADFDLQYRVNLRGPYVLTRALLDPLRRARGQVVFVNSSAALRASSGNALYAATKGGLKLLADGLRAELNPVGVRVLTLFVGRVATPMQAYVHEAEGKTYAPESLLQAEDIAEVVVSSLRLERTAEITEINVRSLAKPEGSA